MGRVGCVVKELPVARFRRIFGCLLAGCALSCARAGDNPNPVPKVPRENVTDRHALTLAALDCAMTPVIYDTPAWASNDREMASLGPDTSSCTTAAEAIGVRPARIYRLSPDVIFDLRHAISRGTAATESSPDATDLLSFFDRSLAAILEARQARAALDGQPSNQAVDRIRARQMVDELVDFGRSGGASAVEARAVAMLLAASRFLQVGRVKPEDRWYVAEPLFTMMFGSKFIAESSGEWPASWNDYLAAAARAVPRHEHDRIARRNDTPRPALGGGPRDPETGDLDVVTSAAVTDMNALAADLDPGFLRVAVLRTMDRLATFAIDDGTRTP
jgi:hypothetical protein